MIQVVVTPWDDATILKLNKYQGNPNFHPYTCGNDDLHGAEIGMNPILVATRGGWSCPARGCFYLQQWAYTASLEGDDES